MNQMPHPNPYETSPLPEAIRRDIESIRASLSVGFEALNERLDQTNDHLKEMNGRVRRAEGEIIRHEERFENIKQRSTRIGSGLGSDDDRRITQRDVRMLVAGILATSAVLTTFWKILPIVLKALQP